MRALCILLALAFLSSVHRMAVTQFAFHARTLFPASRMVVRLVGGATPDRIAASGVGEIERGLYVVPREALPGPATLVGAASGSVAVRTIRVTAPPRLPLIAVATYDDGIAFHDPRTFAMLGVLATGGAPSDVIATRDGFAATDTDGTAFVAVGVRNWSVVTIPNLAVGDAILDDDSLHAFFASQRTIADRGGIVRVDSQGVRRVLTGTAEGAVLDARRQRVYVADADPGDVTAIDARRMRVLWKLTGLPRAFALALSADGGRLYVVSNQGRHTFFAAAGRVTEIDIDPHPHVAARSGELPFPVGIALDERSHRVFVTDEESDAVYVLDDRTLHPAHAPLHTCSIPWNPDDDVARHRLYVPCAGSNAVDAFDTRSLRRERGAPFATGGYPLAVAASS